MSQILDSFERGSLSCRGYIAQAKAPQTPRLYGWLLNIALTAGVAAFGVYFLGAVLGSW